MEHKPLSDNVWHRSPMHQNLWSTFNDESCEWMEKDMPLPLNSSKFIQSFVIQQLNFNSGLTYSSLGDEQCSTQLFSQHSPLGNLTFCNNTNEQLNIKTELVLWTSAGHEPKISTTDLIIHKIFYKFGRRSQLIENSVSCSYSINAGHLELLWKTRQ
jgi:hypothetical protein